jgi:hypothetical protein
MHDLPGCACFLSPIWHIKITGNLRRRLKSRVWNITQPSMPGFLSQLCSGVINLERRALIESSAAAAERL